MRNIHSTAIISPKARIGQDVTIGPYSVIHDDVEIGDGCRIGPSVNIYDGARLGSRVTVYQSASIAHIPQDLKFSGEPTLFIVGDDTTIHEFVTLHRGTSETGKSEIGKKCLLMAYVHVAHDCKVGDNCVIANGVQIGGHAEIENNVTIGGLTPVHQFSHIGQHSMIGGGFRVTQDVPPFVLAASEPLRYSGLNVIGLRRRGFSNSDIMTLKDAYNILYTSGLNISQAKEKMRETYPGHPLVENIINFIERSKRTIIRR
ncbi:MAG: acyl-ACP--UDP-N-acetylglucosamine O-acyltransferase [Bacteroidota bacterium]